MIIITDEFLIEKNACRAGYDYVREKNYIGLTDCVKYCVFTAEQVIDIYKKECLNYGIELVKKGT